MLLSEWTGSLPTGPGLYTPNYGAALVRIFIARESTNCTEIAQAGSVWCSAVLAEVTSILRGALAAKLVMKPYITVTDCTDILLLLTILIQKYLKYPLGCQYS